MPVRICIEPTCAAPATYRGRCPEHSRERERERSAQRRKATKGVYNKMIWRRRREQVLNEDPWCAICRKRLAEEVDHITPLTAGGAPYARDNLRGLCTPCHIERHQGDGRPQAA